MKDWSSAENNILPTDVKSAVTEIKISDDVTVVGAYSFAGYSNALIANPLQKGTTQIKEHAFADCKMPSSLELSSKLTSIGAGAFENCTGFSEITCLMTNDNVTEANIGKDAFKNCGKITFSIDYAQEAFWKNYFTDPDVTLKIRYPVLEIVSVTPSATLTEAGAKATITANRPVLTWTAEPTGIVEISGSGASVTVTAITNSQATVKATASDGSSKTTTITVQIAQNPAPGQDPTPGQDPSPAPVVLPVSVQFKQAKYEIQASRDETAIGYTVEPVGASEESFVWTISNEKIATVNTEGYVTGLKKGKATLTLTYTNDKGESKEIQATIVVKAIPAQVTVSELAIRKGTKVRLKKITKAYGNWKVEDENIARITEKNGKQKKLKALNVGDTKLTYTLHRGNFYWGDTWYGEGDTISIVLHVLPEKPQVVKKIKIQWKYVMDLEENKVLKLEPKIVPETAEYEALMYFSSNPAVATVSQDGVVTAVGKGRTKITITSTSLKKKTVTIKVK